MFVWIMELSCVSAAIFCICFKWFIARYAFTAMNTRSAGAPPCNTVFRIILLIVPSSRRGVLRLIPEVPLQRQPPFTGAQNLTLSSVLSGGEKSAVGQFPLASVGATVGLTVRPDRAARNLF